MSLSVMENNCWLVAERTWKKKVQSSTLKYCTPSKLQDKIKKNAVALNPKKSFFLRKLKKCKKGRWLFLSED